jgi:hypothetical protein
MRQEILTMQDLKRIRYIAGHYNALRGLKLLPAGLGLIAIAVWSFWLRAIVLPGVENGWEDFAAFLLIYSILFALEQFVERYYRRNFGQVAMPPQEEANWRLTAILLFFIYGAGTQIDSNFHPMISAFGLATALFLCFYWWQMGREQTHYLVLGLLVAVASIVPLFSSSVRALLFSQGTAHYYHLVDLLAGVIFFVGGIFDHLLLMRALAALKKSRIQQDG